MTSADPEEVVTATSDGVTVEKSFEPDDFPVPAIAFVVRSDRDEAVSIRLVDDVPEDVAPENIGFHPKYGAEYWGIEGDTIVFEREIDPGEEYTTVYGLRGSDPDIAAKFMGAPRLESVDPPLEVDAIELPDEGDDDAEESAEVDDTDPSISEDLASDLTVGPSVDKTETTVEELVNSEDVPVDEDQNENENQNEDEIENEISTQSTSIGRSGEDSLGSGDGRLVDELAREVRAADPDDPEISTLREALGLDPARASVETRIEHLQSSVADLEAYTDALEAFLDENGDAQQLIDDVRNDYEETTERLDDVEALAEDATESVSTVEERFEAELEELDSKIETVETDMDALSTELSEVTEMRNRLASALGGLAEEPTGDADDE